MPTIIREEDGITTYDFTDSYEPFDGDYCPACCSENIETNEPQFMSTDVIQVYAKCKKCGRVITFNYFLSNAVVQNPDVF